MIKALIKIATRLDKEGKVNKADRLDNFIMKYAQEGKEPSPEDLLKEEGWLAEEGIDPYTLTETEAFEGLEGDDLIVADEYMDGGYPEDIKKMMLELNQMQEREVKTELDQQSIIEQLSKVLMQGAEQGMEDPSRFDTGNFITPEASMINDITKLADMLDEKGMHLQADYFTNILKKMAEPGDFDDMFDDMDMPPIDDSDYEEPSNEELEDLEDPFYKDNQFYLLLGFVERVANGMYMNLDTAKIEAQNLVKSFDTSHKTLEMPKEDPQPPSQPDNVVRFSTPQ